MVSIAIDAMGGDFGPKPIVDGVIEALKEKEFEAILVGNVEEIKKLVPKGFDSYIHYLNANEVFSMSEGATDVIKKNETSIFKAVELVKENKAQAIVSAGHSGATMSLATLKIGRLKNVLRPAIATLMPNSTGNRTLILDVGANVDCKAEHLFQFGVMGEEYAKNIMGIPKPKVGILSNGEEDSKGNETTKEAFKLLKRLNNFIGNIEGNQIFDNSVDVVICDGFIGNIVLKTSEGIAHAMNKLIKNEAKQSPIAIIGALLMKGAFKNVKKHTDYDEYGGAPLIGVKGCVIVSHGKSTSKAIKNAIFQAIKFANSNIDSAIEKKLLKFK